MDTNIDVEAWTDNSVDPPVYYPPLVCRCPVPTFIHNANEYQIDDSVVELVLNQNW